ADAVDQQVARGGEHEQARVVRLLLLRGFANTDIDFLQQVVDVAAVAPVGVQVLRQSRLQGQDVPDEPGPQFGRVHARTITARIAVLTGDVRCLCHPSRAARLPRVHCDYIGNDAAEGKM